MGIRFRSLGQAIAVAMVGISLSMATALILLSGAAQRQLQDVMVAREISALAATVNAVVEAEASKAAALAASVAAAPGIAEAFAEGDRARLLAISAPILDALRGRGVAVDQFQFHIPPATSFLRVHRPGQHGDDLSGFRATVVAANRERRAIVGLEGGVAGIGFRGVVPIVTHLSQLTGHDARRLLIFLGR